MSASPLYAGAVKAIAQQIVNADASTLMQLYSAANPASRVVGLQAVSSDTSPRVIKLWVTRSSVDYLIGSVNVPAASGNDGSTAAINLLSSTLLPGLPRDENGNPFIELTTGDVLKASSGTTVTSGKTVHITGAAKDFT